MKIQYCIVLYCDLVARRILEALFGKAILEDNDIKPSSLQLATALGHLAHLSILPLRRDGINDVNDENTFYREMDAFEVIVRSRPYIAAAVHRAISHRQQQVRIFVFMPPLYEGRGI